jgi:hypothetical protein
MRCFMSLLALMVLANVTRAEPVDNPEFTSWAKFPAGSSVTMKTVTQLKDFKSEVKVTSKLVSVAADKLVIETESITVVNGMEFKGPPMKRDVLKKVDVPKAADPAVPPVKPEGKTESGTETLKIAGTEVKTKWTKFQTKANGTDVESQTWTSEDVPGMMVKVVTNSGETKMTMELVEIKKP